MRLLLTPMILAMVIFIALDIYIWKALRDRCHSRGWSQTYAATAIAVVIAIVVTVCLPRRSGADDQLIAITWSLYAFLTLLVAKLLFVLIDIISKLPLLWHKHRLKWLSYTGLAISIGIIAVMAWGAFVNRFHIQIKDVNVYVDNLPEAFDGMTIAQLSDMHVGTYGSDTTFVSQLVSRVNKLKPDMIVFTGDIVNRHAPELHPFIETLSRLSAPKGVYAILGNHDYGDYYDWPSTEAKAADREDLIDSYRATGIDLILNSHRWIHADSDSIALIGVENIGDPPFHVYGSLIKAYPTPGDSATKILLSHNPSHWVDSIKDNEAMNIALTLAGHTHAMQISIGDWSPSQWRYKTWGGLYTDTKSQSLYVNIGTGTVGMPARIGANPEITLITLHKRAKR